MNKGYFRVVNIKGEPDFQPTKDEILILMDRTNPILGNKHPMKFKNWRERDRVIDLFSQDLDADFLIEGPMYQALLVLAKRIVDNNAKIAGGCHCAGAPCHVDIIALRIDKLINQMQQYSEPSLTNNRKFDIK